MHLRIWGSSPLKGEDNTRQETRLKGWVPVIFFYFGSHYVFLTVPSLQHNLPNRALHGSNATKSLVSNTKYSQINWEIK